MKQFLRSIFPPSVILFTHKLRARLAAIYHGYPGKKLIVIGVTGTKGKTTTTHLIANIIEEAGYKVGMFSTVAFKIGKKSWPNETNMGTLPPWQLQKLLKLMVDSGCQYAVIEVTSHALAQERVYGINFAVAVFTNLTHDHLDYHGSFEEYKVAKGLLFNNNPKISVVNVDDKAASYFWRFPAEIKVDYGLDHRARVTARKIVYDATGTRSDFTLTTPIGETDIHTTLPGRFNVYNILAAAGVALGLGLPLATIRSGIMKLGSVPGRMERVDCGQPFTTIVDYAHTPDSFEKVYETLRPVAKGRIIHVFGCTGDRDKSKRPIMGAIAGRSADVVIVTDEEPYTEDPAKIIDEIASGVPRGASKNHPMVEDQNFFKILDRRTAVAKALSIAERDDIVLVTGMGALTYRTVGTRHLPWKDQEVICEEWGKIAGR